MRVLNNVELIFEASFENGTFCLTEVGRHKVIFYSNIVKIKETMTYVNIYDGRL